MILKNTFKFLNEFLYKRCIRRYQKDLIENKCIKIPFYGKIECILIKNYFYFDGNLWYCAYFKNFGLLIDTGKIAKAYKINRIVMFKFDKSKKLVSWQFFLSDAKDEIILSFDSETFFYNKQNIFSQHVNYKFKSKELFVNFISYIQNINFDFSSEALKNFYIQIGHKNFAHFIWNELSAVLKLIQENVLIPPLIFICNPLGDFSWGEALDSRIIKSAPENSAPLRVGSMLISSDCRKYVIDLFEKSPKLKLRNHRNLLWLSVKSDARCPINQVEFLVEIAFYWLNKYGDVILDGFTPSFVSITKHHLGRKFKTDSIIHDVERIIKDKSTKFNLYTTTGMTLHEAIHYTKFASFYISPLGTIQHKIGWIRNIPGILHCGDFKGRANVNLWHSNQVEGGIVPGLLPLESIKNYDYDDVVKKINVRYLIDVNKSIDFLDQYVTNANLF